MKIYLSRRKGWTTHSPMTYRTLDLGVSTHYSMKVFPHDLGFNTLFNEIIPPRPGVQHIIQWKYSLTTWGSTHYSMKLFPHDLGFQHIIQWNYSLTIIWVFFQIRFKIDSSKLYSERSTPKLTPPNEILLERLPSVSASSSTFLINSPSVLASSNCVR